MPTIITKNSSTASSVPTAAQLVKGELAVNVTDKRLFTEDNSGNIVELGTNPSSLALPSGSVNGVAYLNGSKVLTTGSALSFDGTNLGLGVTPSAWKSSYKGFDIGTGSLSAAASIGLTQVASNAYYNASNQWIYKVTDAATYYQQYSGTHQWFTAPSGTAGNTISFTQAMTLSAAGGLSVGTTADPGAGAIYATGNITAYYSDQRLKTVSGRIENALDKVDNLSGVYYTNNDVAKAHGYTSEDVQVGVLAQEVEAVLPQVVKAAPFDLDENGNSKSGENYKTVQYDRLVPLLIEAIKELRAEVKELKGA